MKGRVASGTVIDFSLQPLNASILAAFLEIPRVKSFWLLYLKYSIFL
jgi:hypothetical protein